MTESEVTTPRCASCGRVQPGAAPPPAGHILLCVEHGCAELRLAGARYARGLEDQDLGAYLAARAED